MPKTLEIEVYIIKQLVGGPDMWTSFKMTAASWEREEDSYRSLLSLPFSPFFLSYMPVLDDRRY